MSIENSYQHSYPEINSVDSSTTADSLTDMRLCKADVAMDDRDWDALFNAVKQRLTESVSELPACRSIESGAASYVPRTNLALHNLKLQVLDCVEGLAKLHAALRGKRAFADQGSTPECEPTSLEANQ